MAYKTTKAIRDTQDNDFCYYAGAIYPRKGLEVSQERLDELEKGGWIVSDAQKDADYSKMTVSELKDALDRAGISYDEKAKKADLVKLLEG